MRLRIPPYAVFVLGAPASGKSYSVNILKELDSLNKIISNSQNATIDILRSEFLLAPGIIQLYEYFKTYSTIYDLSKKDPLEYGKWFLDYQKLFKTQIKPVLNQFLPNIEISLEGNLTFHDLSTKKEVSIFAFLGLLNTQQIASLSTKLFGTTSSQQYNSLKRIIRHVQETTYKNAIRHKNNLYFDETGDEPTKILDKATVLKKEGYCNIIVLIHPKSIAFNYIQNAGRMVIGSDGGRDSSTSIAESYGKLEKFKRIYTSLETVDSTHILRVDNLAALKTQPTVISKINELTKKVTTDKEVEILLLVEPSNTKESFERILKVLDEKESDKETAKNTFLAILKLHLDNRKKTTQQLLTDIDPTITQTLSRITTTDAFKAILSAYLNPRMVGVQIDTIKEAIHVWNIQLANYGMEEKAGEIIQKK